MKLTLMIFALCLIGITLALPLSTSDKSQVQSGVKPETDDLLDSATGEESEDLETANTLWGGYGGYRGYGGGYYRPRYYGRGWGGGWGGGFGGGYYGRHGYGGYGGYRRYGGWGHRHWGK